MPSQGETPSAHAVARFIAEGDKRPSKGRAISRTYRLNQVFIDVMEADAQRMGQGNTDILKAALTAWNSMDDNTKFHWLLESNKM
ncbi:stability/ partitioning determinant [Salmonella enterica subsp. enterica serovar Newport]|nr:stability/ partitioning determinant [Salmonella enterica]EBS2907407.1 stability/ partitioning determinant [Salmonella enterica subsp. enterica serovar Flottbek]EBX7833910.1 stability/ partitioning determinant [Salmonella enterica subsp. enterica serovar Saintpaul]ECA0403581.1 stability/ partitioning determinant [Salmonella enterica subsp. enterica serovar Newport]ECI4531879.1 stability/ partitioning determinant [Salmonella enterica subsp. diarizonae]EDQ4604298.1 stability/ partitioning dete